MLFRTLLVASVLTGCTMQPAPSPSAASPTHGGKADDVALLPIILAHGFNASDDAESSWSFRGVAEVLEDEGRIVVSATVPPYNSAAVRAEYLASLIDSTLESTGAERVVIIAHSMGGLDARYAITSLGYGDRVAALLTVSTPHRGSLVADAALLALGRDGSGDLVDSIFSLWGQSFSPLAVDTDARAAFDSLSEAAAPQFNADNPDDERVTYYSIAGVTSVVLGVHGPHDDAACEGTFLLGNGRPDLMDVRLKPMAAIVTHGTALRPNDGMVTVESAKWGTFLGCIPADHLDEVGQGSAQWAFSPEFDHLALYRDLENMLEADGF